MPATLSWMSDACERLLRMRDDSGGWGYRSGDRPAVEPTVLSALALHSASASTSVRGLDEVLTRAAYSVAGRQQADGSVALCAELTEQRWATAHAVLLWSIVDGFSSQRNRACRWLEQARGQSYRNIPESPIGHDTSIVGWPWVEGTHPWVEPTAMAIIALARAGHGRSPRVDDGVRLLLDRAIASGGWNYGNNVVFQTVLRPQPAPTGVVLVALACTGSRARSVAPALDYLEATLPQIRSVQSLSWGLLGLTAWNRRPDRAMQWLRDAYSEMPVDAPFELALLSLAGHEQALNSFGLSAPKEVTPS